MVEAINRSPGGGGEYTEVYSNDKLFIELCPQGVNTLRVFYDKDLQLR
jgi:hypothetical protein